MSNTFLTNGKTLTKVSEIPSEQYIQHTLNAKALTKGNLQSKNDITNFEEDLSNAKRKYTKKTFDQCFFDKFEQRYYEFLEIYQETVCLDEISQIIERKKIQAIKSPDQLKKEFKAVVNFFYRHFQIILLRSDLTKIITSGLSQNVSCQTFFEENFQQNLKTYYSNLKRRIQEVESKLCQVNFVEPDKLPPNFDLAPFKKVFVFNNEVETYLKKHIHTEDKGFGLVMFSKHKINQIKSSDYEHVFIDGTKSSIPFDQRYQLLMINVLLNNGQTTTAINVLLRGSNQTLYEIILTYVNEVITLKDKQIHCDFERALINASLKFSSSTNLCHFYFARNLQDRVRDLQRQFRTKKISKKLYEYGKMLMFVPPKFVIYHRKYMKYIAGRNLVNLRFMNYLDKTYIDKRYKDVLYQKHSKFLTNNISESINGQMSNYFKKKPGKYEWLDFMLFNEKRIVKAAQQINPKTNEYDLDDYDKFILELQSKKNITYASYRRFLRDNEKPKGIKKNLKKDRRYFRRPALKSVSLI